MSNPLLTRTLNQVVDLSIHKSITVGRSLHVTSQINPGNVLFCSSRTPARGSVGCILDLSSFFFRCAARWVFLGSDDGLSAPHTPPACFTVWKSALFGPCFFRFSFTLSLVLCLVLTCARFSVSVLGLHQKKMTDLHHCYLSTPKRRFDH